MNYGLNITVNGDDVAVEVLADKDNKPSKRDIIGVLEMAKVELLMTPEMVDLKLEEIDFSDESPLKDDLEKTDYKVGDTIQLPKSLHKSYLTQFRDKK